MSRRTRARGKVPPSTAGGVAPKHDRRRRGWPVEVPCNAAVARKHDGPEASRDASTASPRPGRLAAVWSSDRLQVDTCDDLETIRDRRPMKRCPCCAEEIQDQAVICRYCGCDPVAGRLRRVARAPHPRDWISRTASFGCGTLLALVLGTLAVAALRGLLWP